VDVIKPQRKRTTEKHLEKRSGEGNVDSGLQVQLEEDGEGSTGQSWVETISLCSVAYAPLGVTTHKSSKSLTPDMAITLNLNPYTVILTMTQILKLTSTLNMTTSLTWLAV